ncbi:hypothetical protein BKA61DRAFT_625745 [Leptodontidium sp. MPI-SDFR-AT-0119]|nr:hypothetical protein BKA61DRAFT_625745 [Leptodontidium sp. MPI-SDFR-AT-0119]
MSEERRGRRRLSSSGRRSETRKGPVVLPALPTLSGFSEAAHQQFSPPQKHKTQAIKGPRRATPTHKPSDKDVRKQIKVFSNKDDWTEVTATFVDDLVEAWISKDVFEHLELDAFPGTPGDPEWGVLGMKSVPLGGTTDLQWFPKDCKKVKDTRCRIVESKDFEVYLQSHLLPSNGSSGSKSSSVEIPSSPKLIPEPPASPLRKLAMVDSPPIQKDPLDTDTATLKEDIDRVSGIVPKGSFDGLPENISETSVE